MNDECDHYLLATGAACPHCGYVKGITVECDDHCGALLAPVTLTEALAAVEHWRNHSILSGCSHGGV